MKPKKSQIEQPEEKKQKTQGEREVICIESESGRRRPRKPGDIVNVKNE